MSYVFTLLMWAVSLSAFDAVFKDRSWIPALGLAVLLPVSIEYVTSRFELGRWGPAPAGADKRRHRRNVRAVGFGAHLIMFFGFVGLLAFRDTLFMGFVPTPSTVSALVDTLVVALPLIRESPAPVDPHTTFVVVAAGTIWLAAAASSAATWAAETPALGAVLPLTIFTFASVFAQAAPSPIGVGLLVVTAVGMVISADHERLRTRPRKTQLLATGTIFGVAIVAAAMIAPQLPKWGDPPILDYTNVVGTNVSTNPLVDIRPRLVDQSDRTVFEVRGYGPSYWRLTSLDRFDGRVWARTDEPPELPQRLDGEATTYRVRTTELSSPWLPAAPYPTSPSESTSIDAATSSLVVPDRTDEGTSYEITSTRFEPTAAELNAASAPDASGDLAHYLDLPDISPRVEQWGADVSSGAATDFEAAVAIQNELRSFTYSLDIESGHGSDAMETFLYETRTGYCEQFSTAMAVVARSIGIPSRVAVGYLSGVARGDARYAVRGRDSHAWPELYFAGIGWVPFEPTPSRGNPDADYLGDLSETGAPPPDAAASGSEQSPQSSTEPAAPPDASGPEAATAPGETGSPESESSPGTDSGSGANPVSVSFVALVLAVLAVPVGIIGAKALRSALRRRRGATGAWLEARDRGRDLGLDIQPGSTPMEVAEVCSAAGFDISPVVAAFSVAEFSPDADADPLSAWRKLREAGRAYASANPWRTSLALISLRSFRHYVAQAKRRDAIVIREKVGAGKS